MNNNWTVIKSDSHKKRLGIMLGYNLAISQQGCSVAKEVNVALARETRSNCLALACTSKTLAGMHCLDLGTSLLEYSESIGKYPEKSNQ